MQVIYMSCISKTACFSVNCAPLSLQFGWNEELKGSNGSHPSEYDNRTPPSKSDTAPFWHAKPQPIRGFPAIEPVTFWCRQWAWRHTPYKSECIWPLVALRSGTGLWALAWLLVSGCSWLGGRPSLGLAATSKIRKVLFYFICLACSNHYSPYATTISSVEEIVIRRS